MQTYPETQSARQKTVAYLDDFQPKAVAPLCVMPSLPEGAFYLGQGGTYGFWCLSYCLDEGKSSPTGAYFLTSSLACIGHKSLEICDRFRLK